MRPQPTAKLASRTAIRPPLAHSACSRGCRHQGRRAAPPDSGRTRRHPHHTPPTPPPPLPHFPQGNLKCFAANKAPVPLFDELQLARDIDLHIEWEHVFAQQQQQEAIGQLTCSAHQKADLEQLRALLLVSASGRLPCCGCWSGAVAGCPLAHAPTLVDRTAPLSLSRSPTNPPSQPILHPLPLPCSRRKSYTLLSPASPPSISRPAPDR